MCIAYRSKANTDEVMGTKHETKGNHSRRWSCLLNVTYYKLWTRKHFAYYIISQGIESYRVGGVHKIFNQALMLPRAHYIQKTWGRSQRLWPEWACAAANAMAAPWRTPWRLTSLTRFRMSCKRTTRRGIDKSRRMIRRWSKALQLGR